MVAEIGHEVNLAVAGLAGAVCPAHLEPAGLGGLGAGAIQQAQQHGVDRAVVHPTEELGLQESGARICGSGICGSERQIRPEIHQGEERQRAVLVFHLLPAIATAHLLLEPIEQIPEVPRRGLDVITWRQTNPKTIAR